MKDAPLPVVVALVVLGALLGWWLMAPAKVIAPPAPVPAPVVAPRVEAAAPKPVRRRVTRPREPEATPEQRVVAEAYGALARASGATAIACPIGEGRYLNLGLQGRSVGGVLHLIVSAPDGRFEYRLYPSCEVDDCDPEAPVDRVLLDWSTSADGVTTCVVSRAGRDRPLYGRVHPADDAEGLQVDVCGEDVVVGRGGEFTANMPSLTKCWVFVSGGQRHGHAMVPAGDEPAAVTIELEAGGWSSVDPGEIEETIHDLMEETEWTFEGAIADPSVSAEARAWLRELAREEQEKFDFSLEMLDWVDELGPSDEEP